MGKNNIAQTISFVLRVNLQLLLCGPRAFEETDGFSMHLRVVMPVRGSAITRLVIPPLRNTDMFGSLNADEADVEVRTSASYLSPCCLSQITHCINDFAKKTFFTHDHRRFQERLLQRLFGISLLWNAQDLDGTVFILCHDCVSLPTQPRKGRDRLM